MTPWFTTASLWVACLALVAAAPGCRRDRQDVEPPPSERPQSEPAHPDRPATQPAAPAASIEDTTWQLATVAGRAAEPTPPEARAAHLRLSRTDRRATGYTGVNTFSGPYTLDGASLRFGPLAMTRRAGPEPLNRQEAAFSRALADTRAWRLAGDRLEHLDASGNPLATLTRQPEP